MPHQTHASLDKIICVEKELPISHPVLNKLAIDQIEMVQFKKTSLEGGLVNLICNLGIFSVEVEDHLT